jgi:DNA helicase II / ATP-dependent DNA helicase PcrA
MSITPPAGAVQLSPEQVEVVNHRAGHLQVVACAGSGKTEAIANRVAALIGEGTEPRAIVAFTFTERAAASLKARITRRVTDIKGEAFLDQLGPMFVGTIHGYCLRLLQEHVPEFGNYDVLDEHRLAGLLSRESKRLGLDQLGPRHWRPIQDFRRNVEVVENELIDASSLVGTPLGDCYIRYLATLERYHFLTFGQLISRAIGALETPAIFQRVHRPLRHLFVDEYQDVNPAQERLVERLAQPPVTLCVVGDDDQSIYQWRGSDVDNILKFRKRYKAASKPLTVNRRSRPTILKKANAFAKTISPRLDKAMGTFRDPADLEVHGWLALTPEDEAAVIADTVLRLRERGYRHKDIAVLYRSVRTSSPPLVDALKARGIPFRCAGRTGLFLQPEAAALGRLYAYLCGNDWKSERYSQPEPVTLDGLVTEFTNLFGDGTRIEGLKAYLASWQKFVTSETQQVNLVRDYYRFLRQLNVQSVDLQTPQGSARMGCLARFSQILADYEHVTRRARFVNENGQDIFRGGQDRGKWFYLRLFSYLQHYALDAYEDFEGEETFDLDAVNVLTVHQAKGLEWPVVLVPSLVKGRFPSKRAGESQDWLLSPNVFPAASRRRYEGGETEERRLFYVAITRARDILYASAFLRKKNAFQPSVFLADLKVKAQVEATLPLPPPFAPPADEAEEEPTLSFSELAQYDRCPQRYRLSSSLGFQPQLATELGYGKAVHHILRRLADLTRERKRLPTAPEVDQVFRDEFYLPFANRAAFEQLQKKAQLLVDRYLADYKQDWLRVWETERPFELHVPRGIVNGRADVILDGEGGVRDALALVDYKTATDAGADEVFAFQLAIYAAAGRGEGINVRAAYLHELANGVRKSVNIDDEVTAQARERADTLLGGVIDGVFPARPERPKCRRCDVRAVCGQADCGKYDF